MSHKGVEIVECFACFQVMSGKESSDRYSRFRSERFRQGHVSRGPRTVRFQDQERAPAQRRSSAVGRDRSSSHSVPARQRSLTVGRERPSSHRDRRWTGPVRVSRDYRSSARRVRTQSPHYRIVAGVQSGPDPVGIGITLQQCPGEPGVIRELGGGVSLGTCKSPAGICQERGVALIDRNHLRPRGLWRYLQQEQHLSRL